MEVHKELGCGFLEALYQEAFEHELKLRRIDFVRQKPHRVAYKDIILRHPYIPDLIVEEKVVVDLKAVREIGAIEEAQMINYLKITKVEVGLIVNFANRLQINNNFSFDDHVRNIRMAQNNVFVSDAVRLLAG